MQSTGPPIRTRGTKSRTGDGSLKNSVDPGGASSASGDALLALEGISKYYGDVRAAGGIDLKIAGGEFVTLLGPSGSGKTTLLSVIAGFTEPDEGSVILGGRDITRDPPHKRELNTVFQGYALFPHLDVTKNVAFGLRMKGVPKADRASRVEEALEMVQMSSMADRRIDNLSGGQQQRVALARALVNRPQLVLLDEPLSALDAKLRKTMQLELKRIQEESGSTFVYVTHDQEEALVMSDRIFLVHNGQIEQAGSPDDLYHCPANRFVAGFIGRNNFVPGQVEVRDGETCFVVAEDQVIQIAETGLSGSAILAVRPERLEFSDSRSEGALPAEVLRTRFLGDRVEADLRLEGGTVISLYSNGTGVENSQNVFVRFPREHCQVLPPE